MTQCKKFSELLYNSRINRGMSQEDAAEHFQISVRWFQSIEHGDRIPGGKLLLEMIAFFEIDGKQLNG